MCPPKSSGGCFLIYFSQYDLHRIGDIINDIIDKIRRDHDDPAVPEITDFGMFYKYLLKRVYTNNRALKNSFFSSDVDVYERIRLHPTFNTFFRRGGI